MGSAIRVEGLSKCYQVRLGEQRGRYRTLRETLTKMALAPMRRWRHGDEERRKEDFWALRDVSFQVEPGEVVGIIGRNGAGKSTLLKILSRITKPTRGAVKMRGRLGSLLEVGSGFHPELTGRENIYLNGSILGMARQEINRQFDNIVAFSEVERFLDTPVKRYSSGMYVRLAFAVAAHLEPEILLVDEVLAVGDAQFQNKCLGKMQEVGKSGRTILFVSHNLAVLQQLCQRAIHIHAGTLAEDGPSEQVVANYLRDAALSEEGKFDLSQHRVRSPRHRSILKELVLRSTGLAPTNRFYPDEPLNAELLIEPPFPIKNGRVALAIEDSLGRRITTVASYFHEQPLPDLTAPCRVRCTLPELQLGSGRYLISISIGDKYNGILDSLDNAAWFEVGWRNNYGNGEAYDPVYGPVLSPSTWEYMGTEECLTGPITKQRGGECQ